MMILHTLTPGELKELIQDAVNEAIEKFPAAEPVKEDKLITLNECAILLGVSRVTIFSWKKSGKIPFYRLGNRIYFKEKEILNSLTKVTSKN